MSVVTTNSGEVEDSTTAEVAADALDPLVGQVIDGRFRVVDIIGKGAMGKVYRAVQLPLNRAVAVKVLDSTYGAGRDESFKQRFLVEAALTAKLNHPNTVRVVDYGSTKDGLFFFAMEYLDGETLEKLLSKGPLPWHRVLSIGQQMARALREAHELGVVHRDLKPANVVMLHADDDTDFVKVLDFGLVKSFVDGHELEGRAITQQGMLMGSPPYMAPEQGEKNRADPRSDIYSLGTMLFEMLTGKPPYNGGGALEVILKHVNEPIPPIVTPSKFEPVPDAFKAVVIRALAKSPMDRFQSMEELLLAMQDVAPPPARAQTQDVPVTEAAVPVVAPPPEVASETEEPIALAQPPRSPSVLLIAGFFVAALAGVFGTWMIVKPSGAPSKLTFHLESTPSGADVFVDGKKMGVTPIDLEQGLANGRAGIELRLEKEGFVSSTTKLSGNGGRLDFAATLMPNVGSAPAPVTPVELKKPEPRVETPKPLEQPKPEPKLEKPEPKVEKPEPKNEKPEPKVAAPEPKEKKQPEPTNEIDKAFEAKPVKPPVVNTVKNEPKSSSKKSKDSAPKSDGARPASKLDEDDAPAPSPTELKRPTP